MGCLYKIDFANGKSYIGISNTTAMDRWNRHIRAKDSSTLVSRAFQKYGKEKAQLTTLVIASDWNYLCYLETKAIAIFKTKKPYGYNMTDGGEGALGRVWSKEERAKISAFMKGRKKSPESIAATAAGLKGKPKNWTPEWKENIKRSLIGKTWSLGLKRSEETKSIQAKKKRGWWANLSPEDRKKFCEYRVAKRQSPCIEL